jgi:hypothetical protein
MKDINVKIMVAIENIELFTQTINLKDKVLKVIDSDIHAWENVKKAIMESEIPESDKEDFIQWIDENDVNELYDYIIIQYIIKTYHLNSEFSSGFIVPVFFNTNKMYMDYLKEVDNRKDDVL